MSIELFHEIGQKNDHFVNWKPDAQFMYNE